MFDAVTEWLEDLLYKDAWFLVQEVEGEKKILASYPDESSAYAMWLAVHIKFPNLEFSYWSGRTAHEYNPINNIANLDIVGGGKVVVSL